MIYMDIEKNESIKDKQYNLTYFPHKRKATKLLPQKPQLLYELETFT
jgi:hypothetical protein